MLELGDYVVDTRIGNPQGVVTWISEDGLHLKYTPEGEDEIALPVPVRKVYKLILWSIWTRFVYRLSHRR